MDSQRTILVCGTFLFPLYTLAHGEEVLLPLFIQLGLIFIFLIWIATVKFRIFYKLVLAASYFLTLSMILALTWNVSYRENKTTLEIAWIVGPAIITLITFIVLRKKKKHRLVREK